MRDFSPEGSHRRSSVKKERCSGLQLYYKETPTQVFYCEYCKIFKDSNSEEHLRPTASINLFSMFNPRPARVLPTGNVHLFLQNTGKHFNRGEN